MPNFGKHLRIHHTHMNMFPAFLPSNWSHWLQVRIPEDEVFVTTFQSQVSLYGCIDSYFIEDRC
jgi:hypothetical protein